jgi:hypothetical protein
MSDRPIPSPIADLRDANGNEGNNIEDEMKYSKAVCVG